MTYWYWLIQTLMWPFAWILIRLFYRLEIRGLENLKGFQKPLLIVSNHRTLIDSFLIGIILPFGSRFFPLRFMTEEERFHGSVLEFLRKIKLLKLIYLLGGGFSSMRGNGLENAIQTPLKLLARGGTVVMFPEGRLIREGLGVFYPGVAGIALKSGANILPFYIDAVRGTISISVGAPFKLNASGPEEGTKIIREKIASLSY